jgi:UDP-arabinose 4-epimerase
MARTVLVTGGADYVGSHACQALAAASYRPVVYDNLSRGHRWSVQWGPLEVADLQDRRALCEALERHQVAAVLHFAAFAYVGESVRAPDLYFHNNVAGTLALLDAMSAVGVRHLVFSSTCATFGLPQHLPIADDHPQEPISPYGGSKLMVERVLRWYGDARLKWVVLRYFNAAGADPAGELGEAHDPETHLVPIVIETALGRWPRVEIYGTDYQTPDGTCVRDYVHVCDLADAHIKALDYLLEGRPSVALNLGTGRGYSVREVIAAVEAMSGVRIPIQESARRPGDVPVLVADASRAGASLGWQPHRSSLDQIVASAWRWHVRRARIVAPLTAGRASYGNGASPAPHPASTP